MSGKMFPSYINPDCFINQPKSMDSRIPVPSSPTPFRRYHSFRLRGEPLSNPSPYMTRSTNQEIGNVEKLLESEDNNLPVSATTPPSNPARIPANLNHPVAAAGIGSSSREVAETRRQSAAIPLLKRGNSFMERGEKRLGIDHGNHGKLLSAPNAAVAAAKYTPHRPNTVKIANKTGSAGWAGRASLNSPQSPARIRSLSLSLSNTRISSPKSPSSAIATSPGHPITPGNQRVYSSSHLDTWDADSITSIGSSVASCDHASVARNGTTFSGRSMKYVFHCNQHAGASGEDYLTPTQRAQRQVKKLKYLLHQAKKDLEQKDSDILKLTKEVVELRLYKAALNSPEDKSNSSDAVTVRENTSEETTPESDAVDSRTNHLPCELNSSIADSGHFDDGTNSSIHSNDDYTRSPFKSKQVETSDKECTAHIGVFDRSSEQSRLIMEYEKRIQELVRAHEEETYHLKQKHNDKVEELLQRITEINARYWELVPEIDAAREKIKELEHQLEEASKKLEEHESKAKQTYLKMYAQGKEAARIEQESAVMEIARQHPNRVSVPELLNELQVTKNELENIKDVEYASTSNHSQPLLSAKEALSLWVLGARKAMYRQLMEAKSKNKIDPEITLQFLKSAIYYFLTDKENSQGHLKAIQSILGFTPNEIANIDKARLS